MSSRDRLPAAFVAAALVAATVLGGCQMRPLYGAGGAETSGTIAALQTIAVEPLRDDVGQEVVNQLIFDMRGGAALTEKRYVLKLIASDRTSELGIEKFEGLPTATLITLTVTYTLTEIETGRVVTTGTASSTASYDVSSQRFANLRAKRDAEQRAARKVAEDIRTRLATVLAAGS
ncbi:LPS assembly lipoprotein LptE [Chthonobacter albigriseus]|uniref:LPS assembly lipoprotein LptE n=1 Tax=Chthonobacter albigriseus TaxID=1683161 RepID=UPI0015EFAA55|nr:LPS assembly lipoprotein LptE [Chthonobacter albigriseus]